MGFNKKDSFYLSKIEKQMSILKKKYTTLKNKTTISPEGKMKLKAMRYN